MHVARPSADLSARSLPKPAAMPSPGAAGGFGSSLKPAAASATAPAAAEPAPAAAAPAPPKPDLASSLSTVSLAAATPRQAA